MKKIFFLIIIINCTFIIDNCKSQWIQVSNGLANTILSLTNSGNYIFAGTYGHGVYITTNSGNNWTQTSLNNRYVVSMKVNNYYVFAGTDGNNIYTSTNNGLNWTQIWLNNYIYSLAVNENYVYAGTGNAGIYISSDYGNNWFQVLLNYNPLVRSLAVNGNNVFAGSLANKGVYLSTNNGLNWVQSSLNYRSVWAMEVNGNNVYAGTDSGLYLSTNNGINWTLTGLNNWIGDIIVYNNYIFVGSYTNGFYTSSNNGTNWIQKNEGLGNLSVRAFCISNNYLFAGTGGSGVYKRPLSELTEINITSQNIPNLHILYQNYPNPFNPATSIKYQVAYNSFVVLKVYNILGKEVITLVKEYKHSGTYDVQFSINQFSDNLITTGIYFYRIEIYDSKNHDLMYSSVKKMAFIK